MSHTQEEGFGSEEAHDGRFKGAIGDEVHMGQGSVRHGGRVFTTVNPHGDSTSFVRVTI